MLTGQDSVLKHRLQNLALLTLSLVFLPLDTLVLLTAYTFQYTPLRKTSYPRAARPANPKTVLVTGIGMTKGLALARLFYQAGHKVIGADFEPNGALVCGRVSKSLHSFHRLQKPKTLSDSAVYIEGLLKTIETEQVELWVSCSGVASAIEDGQAKYIVEMRTNCKAVQFDVKATQILHEKHNFIEHTKAIGLSVPDTFIINNSSVAEEILKTVPSGRKYILKPIGLDDSARGDMTLLPRGSSEATSKHLRSLKISENNPWILQQFIKGPEFCTHALVIDSEVRAFVACPSSELLMHYEALPPDSHLSQKMLQFTKHQASQEGTGFTGHLSFDFLIEDSDIKDFRNVVLYPIECNPRAHTAVALFGGTVDLVEAYMSLLTSASPGPVITPKYRSKYYWIGHDLVTLLILPAYGVLTLKISLIDFAELLSQFLIHLLFWKDGTFELWDPLPWWWLYHVYWPLQFWHCFKTGQKWSRINVSTTKMFEC